eukprot:COSAG04_NODE_2154_length_4676_cov_9.156859_3_plen_70_part_00
MPCATMVWTPRSSTPSWVTSSPSYSHGASPRSAAGSAAACSSTSLPKSRPSSSSVRSGFLRKANSPLPK